MAMQIEEFTTDEVTSEGEVESKEQVQALVEQLDLGGQKKFFESDQTASKFCYRKMTMQEFVVYDAICPQKTKLAAYGDSVIPLRVLQIAAHANSLNFFADLVVWHPTNADSRDPILVGVQSTKNQWGGHDDSQYLLARWGTELLAFTECIEQARKIITTRLRTDLQEAKAQVDAKIPQIDAIVDKYVTTGQGKVSVYVSL